MNASVIAITGASGYIGRHLVAELNRLGDYQIRLLSRRNNLSSSLQQTLGPNIKIFAGDLTKPESLNSFIPPSSTVVNLAYMWDAGETVNLQATQGLIAHCSKAGISRMIHCSTAAVSGRISQDHVSEDFECSPVTEYGMTKLKIERSIVAGSKDHFDSVILRPTAVFGVDGEPIKKLAADIATGNRLKNYAKSCLFGQRQMNLVHVTTVVAAIVFMIRHPERLNGGVFFVSDDDDPENNFSSVESLLMQVFGCSEYLLPKMPISIFVLRALLTLLGRNNVNPLTKYSPDKLISLGFERPISLVRGLTDYANWYRTTYLDGDVSGSA